MAKLVFFAAVVAALVAISVAADRVAEPVSTQCQCQRELQERSSLGSCQQFVDMQRDMTVPDITWITEERKMRCCQELQHISSGCRAAAIRSIVRKYEQDLEAAQHPQIEGPRYPVAGETAEQQPQQEGGQAHHGCPARRMQTVVRRQPVGGHCLRK
ncbi:glutenin, high molecular weight subunit DY10 [Brachypodium distachyon]|uniref:glutenin, high molecular weight subunit DY10 n=1 Tax=Brachypodium distachyon TaxID=15368 RepID=UPI00052FF02A|nr:glutenin, high molecular weight subunit DY10 [Brachypodium distachyon]|eukprot:XP_010231218.1 glutenin, high molecular weight subunit DY10 [Brachypodium distachyon]